MYSDLDEWILSDLDALYRFAYGRTHDEFKAEDIVQNIVVTAYQAYPRLVDKSRMQAWLWGIARNVIKESCRTSREIPTDEVAIIHAAGITYQTPESDMIRKWDIANVRRAVSFLSKKYRDVCVLYYLENKSYTAISEELDIPLSSVKWRLNQTRGQLREELTRMDYMSSGYRKAVRLTFNMGGWVGKWDIENGCYDNADKALDGLLAQSICYCIYDTPKSVTQIASELGVAAEYIEEVLQKLVDTQSVRAVGTRYQTMFPIWDEAANRDIFGGNIHYARMEAKAILDMLYSLAGDIRDVGFYGSDKAIDRLMVFLIGFLCEQTALNRFETDKLPFSGNDKAWYILATTSSRFDNYGLGGLSSSGTAFGLQEYYFAQKYVKDNRSERSEEQRALYSLYLGETVDDTFSLSKLIEAGKVIKVGEDYRITVPVISHRRGEVARLTELLRPVLEKTNDLQQTIYARSTKTVKKYMPPHMIDQADFFGSYCAYGVLNTALFEEWLSRGNTVTQDMVTWYIVK